MQQAAPPAAAVPRPRRGRVAPDHVHAVPARRYWEHESAVQVAFCRVTALAFLRPLTNPHIMQHGVVTGREAWDISMQWRAMPEVVFLADPEGTDDRLHRLSRTVAIGDHRLVTFDRDFARFPGLSLPRLQG